MTDRELFRHTIATLAYRGGKTLRDAPDGFAGFDGTGKTPVQLLAHLGDLFDWTLRMMRGSREWRVSQPQGWEHESRRFYDGLAAIDLVLASDEPLEAPLERLLQGPIADALTHVGQLAMMRRMAGAPIGAENYYIAQIEAGRVGPDQVSAAKKS